MLIVQPATNQSAFDAELDEAAFKEYTGISTDQAKAICAESDGEIEFQTEFWGPFQDYIADMCKGIIDQPVKNPMSEAEARSIINNVLYAERHPDRVILVGTQKQVTNPIVEKKLKEITKVATGKLFLSSYV